MKEFFEDVADAADSFVRKIEIRRGRDDNNEASKRAGELANDVFEQVKRFEDLGHYNDRSFCVQIVSPKGRAVLTLGYGELFDPRETLELMATMDYMEVNDYVGPKLISSVKFDHEDKDNILKVVKKWAVKTDPRLCQQARKLVGQSNKPS